MLLCRGGWIWTADLTDLNRALFNELMIELLPKYKYAGLFPIWVVIEFFSFNTLSKFYKNLLEKDKKSIAKEMYSVNDYLSGQWMHVLSIQRNICAHYGYLFRREYPIRPIIAKSFRGDPA